MDIIHLFRHLFLPHHTNNHRARILHPRGIITLLSIIICLQISLTVFAQLRPDILGFASDISVDKLLQDTNQKRLENGISPITLNTELSQAAAGKAADMFGNNYWAHISPSGKTPWDFIIGANYQYVYAGENLAKDFQDSQGVVDAWMNSPSHRENLLQGKYQDVGFAVVNGRLEGEETTLVVQMFGTRLGGSQAQVAASEIPKPTVEIVQNSPSPTPASPIVVSANITPPNSQNKPLVISENNPSAVIAQTDVVVRSKPKIDLFPLSRNILTISILLLMVVLFADALIVSRKKIIRISGDNFAHLLVLTCLLAAMFIVSRGNII